MNTSILYVTTTRVKTTQVHGQNSLILPLLKLAKPRLNGFYYFSFKLSMKNFYSSHRDKRINIGAKHSSIKIYFVQFFTNVYPWLYKFTKPTQWMKTLVSLQYSKIIQSLTIDFSFISQIIYHCKCLKVMSSYLSWINTTSNSIITTNRNLQFKITISKHMAMLKDHNKSKSNLTFVEISKNK